MLIHRIYSVFMGYFRPRRLAQFKALLPNINSPIRILDVGGTSSYPWSSLDTPAQVTILNVSLPPMDQRDPRHVYVEGDGCKLPYEDSAFDLVFSNSVIEHVGNWDRQVLFAKEVQRVGKTIYLQTPNRLFFIEPHLIAPFIHLFPVRTKRYLVRWLSLWGWVNRPDQKTIDDFLASIHLLREKEMKKLFPEHRLYRETFLGMTKSFIVVSRAQL